MASLPKNVAKRQQFDLPARDSSGMVSHGKETARRYWLRTPLTTSADKI
jgi:hypothetical protein